MPSESINQSQLQASNIANRKYKHGFVTNIESEKAPKGLDESTVHFISKKKDEPEWMLEFRLNSYKYWLNHNKTEPKWANIRYPSIDYQDIYYYSEPKNKP